MWRGGSDAERPAGIAGKQRGMLEGRTRAGAPVRPLEEFIPIHLFGNFPFQSGRFGGFGLEMFTLQNQSLGVV